MSILSDTKHALGIETDYDFFDTDIKADINSVLRVLNQLGVGNMLTVEGDEDWSDFTDSEEMQTAIKPYVYLKVRKIFDPPTSSVIANSTDSLISEYEWRITAMTDSLRESGSISEDNY